jgi:hypothetical protein
MLNTFTNFLADRAAWNMYITGPAGTGKTTALANLVQHCVDNELSYVVCAYTHKACDILKSKLPLAANVKTLHSLLKKRPTINELAIRVEHIQTSKASGTPSSPQVVFIDEYSMVGERDFMDIGLMQDPDYTGVPVTKVVYIGDSNQLPPVGDTQAIAPGPPYWVKLTHIYRQEGQEGLLDVLAKLVDYINGSKPEPLQPNSQFIRNVDLVSAYKSSSSDKVLLAYTNQKVQDLNAEIAGKATPENNDVVYSPTTKKHYTIKGTADYKLIAMVMTPWNGLLIPNSKYKTLEHLRTIDGLIAYIVKDEEDEYLNWVCVFGHANYNNRLKQLATAAAQSNAAIAAEYSTDVKSWATANRTHPLARARAKAWRDYMTFKDCVICLDFPYASTVHKAQGSTYEEVYVDMEDLQRCQDTQLYLKLLYVAISRASQKCYTS